MLAGFSPTGWRIAVAALGGGVVAAGVVAVPLAAGQPIGPVAIAAAFMGVVLVAVMAGVLGRRYERRVTSAISRIRMPPVLTPAHVSTGARAAGRTLGRRRGNGEPGLGDVLVGSEDVDDIAEVVARLSSTLNGERESLLLATSGADDGLFDINLDSGRAVLSARAHDMLSYCVGVDEGLGLKAILRCMSAGDRPIFLRNLRRFLAPGGGVFEQEVELASYAQVAAADVAAPGWLRFRAAAFRSAHGRARRVAGAIQDISSQKRAEADRLRAVFTDPVTGMANRVRFLEQLDELARYSAGTRRSRGEGGGLWLATIDIDRFRRVNDALGQEAGDAMLRDIGVRLEAEASALGAIAARLGSDLFGFALARPAIESSSDEDVAAHEFGVRLSALFDVPFEVDGVRIHPSVCVGVVSARRGHRADDLLGEASQALAVAKSSGRGQVVVGTRDRTAPFMADGELLVLEADLRRAIAAGDLEVVYQPIVGSDGRGQNGIQGTGSAPLKGVEALVRWDHPRHGRLSPEVFVALAEETNLVVDMGRLVLDRALSDLCRWQGNPDFPDMFVAVNLSRRQLSDPGLVGDVRSAVRRHGVRPENVKLEITESLVMDGGTTMPDTVRALREVGVSLAIDDFGTGHSSLSLLTSLPFDTLKIDRAFLIDIREGKPRAEALLRGIVSLAHRVGMDVVVEGVESAEEAKLMQTLEIAYCQGYYYCRPVEAGQIDTFFRQPVTEPLTEIASR
ncbi:bifunctional diguanylate cyclase/phosphodiesterase [Fodinicurvata sp. EGI_FJ10296]|uniref:putative bifunctional diguanylate cyclase/phosphodiesterase n=1 Tax=Fodinicurvata sp. EGI_FJ10296 TaxID=3231908 RepID=UPI0034547601